MPFTIRISPSGRRRRRELAARLRRAGVYKSCDHCSGSGFVTERHYDLHGYDGYSSEHCSKCEGSGIGALRTLPALLRQLEARR